MYKTAIETLLPIVYQIPFANNYWQIFCDEYYRLTNSPVQLAGYDNSSKANIGLMAAGYCDDANRAYKEYFSTLNPFMHMNAAMRPGQVGDSRLAISTSDLRKTEFYCDWLYPQQRLVGGLATIIHGSKQSLFALSSAVSECHDDEKFAELDQLLNGLSPHFQKAITLARSMDEKTSGATAFRHFFENAAFPVFAVDQDRKILWQNELAENTLRAKRPLRSVQGMLGSNDRQIAVWMDAVSRTQAEEDPAIPLCMAFACPRQGLGVIHWYPLGAANTRAEFPNLLWQDNTGGFFFITRSKDVSAADNVATLANRLSITPAEQILAEALLNRTSLNEFADLNSLSRHTVRNQMRSLLAKTDTRNQQEFILLMSSLVSPFGKPGNGGL